VKAGAHDVRLQCYIPALVHEDRCQIDGLAMEGGKPAYFSAIIRSDTIDG
jgi:hypothetical protein